MDGVFAMLGIQGWKPVLGVLLLPPVPLLVLVLLGARLILPRRGLGWFVILVAVAGLWVTACTGFGRFLESVVLHVPPALTFDRIGELKAQARKTPTTAIVVLGAGMEPYAPEYGVSSLTAPALERLRYATWLARETGLPLAASGGAGWASKQDTAEAQVAARIAAQDFRTPIRWLEESSRDTRENAKLTLPLMQRAGITRIVLVTHGWHMPRALRAFRQAAEGSGIEIEPAPMGLVARTEAPSLDWLPTGNGFLRVRRAGHEMLGLFFGA